jgi:exosome complex RNA-binding protein Rrp4
MVVWLGQEMLWLKKQKKTQISIFIGWRQKVWIQSESKRKNKREEKKTKTITKIFQKKSFARLCFIP